MKLKKMEKLLRPEKFNTDPDNANASKEWIYWHKTFENFIGAITQENIDKLALLTCYIAPKVYEYISECSSYEDAIKLLGKLYKKPKSEVFARYLLQTRKQENGENIGVF